MNNDNVEAYLAEAAAKRTQEEREQRGYRLHWRNLKREEGTWLNGRVWLHKLPRGTMCAEWVVPSRSFHVCLVIGGENQLFFSLACRLFALYFHISDWPLLHKWKLTDIYPGREISFSIHSWFLWWALWTKEREWSADTPKWRHASFNVLDFLLGPAKYHKVEQAPIPATIIMPEGEYPATVTFYVQTWKRPRWFVARRHAGATVDAGDGVPIPGKGESAWDCDDTAILNSSFSVSTVDEALTNFIDTVNERRERYGGPNWRPEKKVTNG